MGDANSLDELANVLNLLVRKGFGEVVLYEHATSTACTVRGFLERTEEELRRGIVGPPGGYGCEGHGGKLVVFFGSLAGEKPRVVMSEAPR